MWKSKGLGDGFITPTQYHPGLTYDFQMPMNVHRDTLCFWDQSGGSFVFSPSARQVGCTQSCRMVIKTLQVTFANTTNCHCNKTKVLSIDN